MCRPGSSGGLPGQQYDGFVAKLVVLLPVTVAEWDAGAGVEVVDTVPSWLKTGRDLVKM